MENKYFLTEDQLAIQALAKDFADNTVAKTVRELDEAHAFPMEEVKMCGELGFLLRTDPFAAADVRKVMVDGHVPGRH